VLFGLVPAWKSLKVQLTPALKIAESGETQRRFVGRRILVVTQVALSMVLLLTAGMLEAGFRRTLALNPRFRTDHLITMALNTSSIPCTAGQTLTFYRNLVDRARVLPGVRSVALTGALPLDRGFGARVLVVPEGFSFPPGKDSESVTATVVD